jgi:hypothetical protein
MENESAALRSSPIAAEALCAGEGIGVGVGGMPC